MQEARRLSIELSADAAVTSSADSYMPIAIVLPDQQRGPARPPSRWSLVWSIASVVFSATIYSWVFVATPAFASLYSGFGADLPWLTAVVLATSRFYGLLLLIGLIPCVILVKRRNTIGAERSRLFKLIALGFGLACTLLGVFTVAMYLPVFRMGAAVS